MSLLRAARRVTSRSGECWELYVSKTALPDWQDGRPRFVNRNVPKGGLELGAEAVVLGFVYPLARFLALLPLNWLRGRRSRAVRIEAVTAFPSRRILLWTTTEGVLDGVLDEIAAGLAEDRVVHPEGAVYSGAEGLA